MIIEKINNFIMKNIFFVFCALILIYLLLGFNGNQPIVQEARAYNNYSESPRMAKMMVADSTPMMLSANAPVNSDQEKVIQNFSLSIEVSNVAKTKDIVDEEIKNLKGVLNNFYSYNYYGNELAYNFSVKIPTDKIEEAVKFFKSLGIVKNESTSASNATNEYYDNQERLKNLYARRDRLREMMKTKTEKLSDVLAVDRELTNVQSTIDSLENANKRIDNDVSYSKLDLSIIPEVNIDSFNNSEWRVSSSWKSAVNTLINFSQKTVDYGFKITVFLPVIIIVVILFFIGKHIFIRNRK